MKLFFPASFQPNELTNPMNIMCDTCDTLNKHALIIKWNKKPIIYNPIAVFMKFSSNIPISTITHLHSFSQVELKS